MFTGVFLLLNLPLLPFNVRPFIHCLFLFWVFLILFIYLFNSTSILRFNVRPFIHCLFLSWVFLILFIYLLNSTSILRFNVRPVVYLLFACYFVDCLYFYSSMSWFNFSVAFYQFLIPVSVLNHFLEIFSIPLSRFKLFIFLCHLGAIHSLRKDDFGNF